MSTKTLNRTKSSITKTFNSIHSSIVIEGGGGGHESSNPPLLNSNIPPVDLLL